MKSSDALTADDPLNTLESAEHNYGYDDGDQGATGENSEGCIGKRSNEDLSMLLKDGRSARPAAKRRTIIQRHSMLTNLDNDNSYSSGGQQRHQNDIKNRSSMNDSQVDLDCNSNHHITATFSNSVAELKTASKGLVGKSQSGATGGSGSLARQRASNETILL